MDSSGIRGRQSLSMSIVKLEMARAERAGVRRDPGEARHFNQLGRGDRSLCGEQSRHVGNQGLRRREFESQRIVERIARESDESRRPHQCRVEDRVGDERCAALIAWAAASWTDDAVIVNADRHRLRVAETKGGGMATGTGVVIMQTQNFVEKQEAPQVGQWGIDSAAKPRFERCLDVAGKTLIAQDLPEFYVQTAFMIVLSLGIRWVHRHENGDDVDDSKE